MQTLLVSVGLIAVAGLAFGGPGIAIAAILSFLGASIRHDNDLGTCFPIALLVVIAVLVPAMFLVLLAVWPRG